MPHRPAAGRFSPIAIVGLGGLFPGAPGLDGFWRTVRDGIDTGREVPPGRWPVPPELVAGGEEPTIDRVRALRACFLDRIPLERLADAGIAERLDLELVRGLDPSVQVALVAGIDAWTSARTDAIDRSRVAVHLGHLVLPTDGASATSAAILGDAVAERLFGARAVDLDRRPAGEPVGDPRDALGAGLPASALARALGLGGGSLTLDAACASSLYAIAQACTDLAEGRIDAALAGGVSRPDALYTQMGFSQLRALSPTGRCHPFDARGQGLVVGEGAGVFLLKRLADAERDGDRIRGVIRGIGLSNDRAGSLLAPESAGQLRALRAAYTDAGWHPSEVDLIECHATGTPVGDATEFASLVELWGDDGFVPGGCALGSVKANIGHLLTAAGAASLTRALLALEHGEIPPTANFAEPTPRIAPEGSPFRFPTRAAPWERREGGVPRRAAVSAFGFGGINAHLLVEEAPLRDAAPRRDTTPVEVRADEPVAIVGMAGRVGPWEDDALLARLLGDDAPVPPPPSPRWYGVESSELLRRSGHRAGLPGARRVGPIEIAPGRFRIPPRELAECLPQQLLFLEMARRAAEDAGLGERPDLGERGAVFTGIALDLASTQFHLRWIAPVWVRRWAAESGAELDPATLERWTEELRDALSAPLTANRVMGSLGSIVASRAAREFRAGGPSHTYSSDETSGFRALERAVRGLARGEFDRAIVGAVDLGGDVRSELSRARIIPPAPDGVARPFSAEGNGPALAEGAVAFVLRRLSDAERDGDRIHAVVEGLGSASGGGVVPARATRTAWRRSVEAALADARVPGDRIGLVIAGTSGQPEEDAAEAAALGDAWIGRDGRPASLASPAERVGHAGAAASLVSVLHAVTALAHDTLPAFPHSGRPRDGVAHELDRRFRRGEASEPWWTDRADGPRRALAGAGGIDGNVAHVVLREGAPTPSRIGTRSPLRTVAAGPALVVVEGTGDADLVRGLDALAAELPPEDAAPARPIAARWLDRHPLDLGRPAAVALVASTAGDLRRRIERARAALTGAVPRDAVERDLGDGATVFSSATPLGTAGTVALLLPGSGNDHAGMGRDLLARFPDVWRPLETTSAHLRSQLPIEALWTADGSFDPSPLERILGHVTVASLAARSLLDRGIRPAAVLGSSLGETASMFALGVWRDRDAMLERLRTSDLFTRQLAGPCRAAARHWELPAGERAGWVSGVVDRPAETVRRAISGRQRVALQIVSTPGECVIGGDPREVEAVVAELGCVFHPVPGVTTVHASVLSEVEEEYRALHKFPVHVPDGIDVYSPAAGGPHALSTESIADSIVRQGRDGFDYVRCIETAYDRGARIFVETGPGSSCTRMVGAILGDRPHRAVSLVRAREPIERSLARVLATLAAERAQVDIAEFVGPPPAEVTAPRVPPVVVESGSEPFALPEWPGGTPRKPSEEHPEGDRRTAEPRAGEPRAGEPRTAEPRAAEPPVPAPRVTTPPPAEPASPPSPAPARRTTPEAPDRAIPAVPAPADRGVGALLAATTASMRSRGRALAELSARQRALIAELGSPLRTPERPTAPAERPVHPADADAWLPRAQCLEFGRGSIATALGDERFAEIDTFPTRVRLPDDPLMLVDRIRSVEGESFSMTGGRVVTEHDVLPGLWYLDEGLAPTCIAVESGQADLFLCAWLGVDLKTRGEAVYRLLDAEVTFHRDLPRVGETIRYDITIDGFFDQGDSLLFRFRFDGTIDGELVLTMRDGCAGFFTPAALAAGRGIIEPRNRPRPAAVAPPGWRPPSGIGAMTIDHDALEALRAGDLAAAFGPAFRDLPLRDPVTIPGGRMRLLDRVTSLDPDGGAWGLGRITAELDIHPDDWFLTCHFTDDPVMPGTLMYECCLHTFRVLLLGYGWIGERGAVEPHPVVGEPGRLRCRGQVVPTSKVVGYDVSVREIRFDPEPTAIADAKMLVDGREIVEMRGLSLRLPGLTCEAIDALWQGRGASTTTTAIEVTSRSTIEEFPAEPVGGVAPLPGRSYVYDHDSILAYALGKPSEAFGGRYRKFDHGFLARLPAPPYCFIDGIAEVEGPPWEQREGTRCVAEYHVPPDAWYFGATRQPRMPFSVLLEAALQPCGWLAAYCGSALTSDEPLHFRNLGGKATQHRPVTPESGLLTTSVALTSFSASAGMLIQHFSMEIVDDRGPVYTGTTYFGFFPRPALAQQLGIRDAVPAGFPVPDAPGFAPHPVPAHPRLPDRRFRMVDRVDALDPRGGPHGLGAIRGSIAVDPDAWFFRAHFHQDPVWPGSLGLESLLQILEVFALERWGIDAENAGGIELEAVACGVPHEWTYRGQVLGHRERVTVEGIITAVDDERRRITADGRLVVDGLWIYGMKDFTVQVVPAGSGR